MHQEKCCDIIDFAAAELRDVADGFTSSMTCPVLAALATADRRKSVPGYDRDLNPFRFLHGGLMGERINSDIPPVQI